MMSNLQSILDEYNNEDFAPQHSVAITAEELANLFSKKSSDNQQEVTGFEIDNSLDLEQFQTLKLQNKDLSRTIDDIMKLLQFTHIKKMFEYICTQFNNYLVPEYLTFIIRPPRQETILQFSYNRLSQVKSTISNDYFTIFKEFFELNQSEKSYYTFEEIEQQLGPQKFSGDIRDRNPYLIFPLKGIEGIYGEAILSRKIVLGEYTPQQILYIERIFKVLAVTIQNGLNYETSIRDNKTGLFTYDYFVSRLKEAIQMASRYKRFSGMIMMDIDFFKKFNDTYGHLAGDRVLIALADTVTNTVRSSDIVARFGGEEFSVIIQECNPETLFIAAERIRNAVSKIELYEKGEKLSITISIGACMIDDTKGLSPKYVVKKADQALYHSKQTGRNKTTVYSMGLLDKVNMLNDLET